MTKQEAERLEDALQRIASGEPVEGHLDPLVQTAHELRVLANAPPPPLGLAPGRRRFLAEASQLRAKKATRPGKLRRMPQVTRLGVALASVLLGIGMLLGAGKAVASSLPTSPLYDLKLLAERARLALTTDPQARAELLRTHAEERLDEIVTLLDRAWVMDSTVLGRTEEQWAHALAEASRLDEPHKAAALQKLALGIQHRQSALHVLAGPTPEPALRELLREMERVRQEAHLGEAEPGGQQERHRSGEPSDPTDLPTPSRTSQPTARPSGVSSPPHNPHRNVWSSETPSLSPTPQETSRPSETPQASQTPQSSQMPTHTAMPSATLQPSCTPHGGGGKGNSKP